MNERLLQYIWQYRYFNQQSLVTVQGDPVRIIATGDLNKDQGPDFSNARISIANTIWAGAVELHMTTSQWYKHGHHKDPNYDKVVLHVVWRNDVDLMESGLPVLELQSRVPAMMLDQYDKWMQSRQAIPCEKMGVDLNEVIWTSWKDRLWYERMQEKTTRINDQLNTTNQHWEEVCWRQVCRYFGGHTNGESFSQVAESLQLNLLVRHKQQIHQLEALLLGQAGLLHPNFTDSYSRMLYNEYQFLQKKYKLRVVNKPPAFLRMRPGNFPTIRLAQLAMLVHKSQHLFDNLCEVEDLDKAVALFDITANDYWHTHYKLDDEAEYKPKHLGRQAIDTVMINAICPLLFAWGQQQNKEQVVRKAMKWLQQLPAEINSVTKVFISLGIKPVSALDSQAFITLKKKYCDARRCLECSVGNALLKQSLQSLQN